MDHSCGGERAFTVGLSTATIAHGGYVQYNSSSEYQQGVRFPPHLVIDPLLDSSQVIAEVEVARGLNSRNDSFLDGDL